MEIISALLTFCAGNSSVTGEYPEQRPVTRRFYVFFDLRLNKRLSKQSWGWWFETPSRSLWRHCNGVSNHPQLHCLCKWLIRLITKNKAPHYWAFGRRIHRISLRNGLAMWKSFPCHDVIINRWFMTTCVKMVATLHRLDEHSLYEKLRI